MSWHYDNDYCPNCGSTNCSASCYYAEREDSDCGKNDDRSWGIFVGICYLGILFIVFLIIVFGIIFG